MHFLNAARHVLHCEERRVEIHKFCDSLRKGYGACFCLRRLRAQSNSYVVGK